MKLGFCLLGFGLATNGDRNRREGHGKCCASFGKKWVFRQKSASFGRKSAFFGKKVDLVS